MKLSTWISHFVSSSPIRTQSRRIRSKSLRKSLRPSWTSIERYEDRVLLSSVNGVVFEDSSGDGLLNPSERTISGFPVSAWNVGTDGIFGSADDQFLATTTTSATGEYSFTLAEPASYGIRFGGLTGIYQFTITAADTEV